MAVGHIDRMPILHARQVSVRYGPVTAVAAVDLALARGELVALVGRNGAGKSSLLRALAGVGHHDGKVSCEGRVGYVPQRATPRWDLPVNVRQVVAAGRLDARRWWRRPSHTDRCAVAAALARLDLTELADRPVGTLSGGQAQRLLLARALAQEPDVLLLDEPNDGLDPAGSAALLAALRQSAADGVAVCCALHELRLARSGFDRVVAIDRLMLADGPAGTVLSPDGLARLFGLAAAV